MDTNFWQRVFRGDIKWVLHTTMTCDLRYSIELAYLQHGKSSKSGGLHQDELTETAVYYYDDRKSRGLTCKVSNDNLQISKYRNLVFPVNDDSETSAFHPTYHAKLSLIAYEKDAETNFKLAIFSKNQEFDDNIAEASMLFDLKISDIETGSGKALCAYLNDIWMHTDEAGKKWFDVHVKNYLEAISHAELISEFDDGQNRKKAELYFGGIHSSEEHICSLGSLLRPDSAENDSVVLTPPEFIRGTNAEKFFREKRILYDLNTSISSKYIKRSSSHIKLYLLHHRYDDTDRYELWMGSANATQRGIGWDFANNKPVDRASIECLVKFDLSETEFKEFRSGLINEKAYGPEPFDFDKEEGSLTKERNDEFGVWMCNHASVEWVKYLDENEEEMDLSHPESSKDGIKSLRIQLITDTPFPYEILKNEDVRKCWRPLEYKGFEIIADSDLGDLSGEIVLDYPINKFLPSQGALCFGISQSVLWIDSAKLEGLPQAKERARMDNSVSDYLLSRKKVTAENDADDNGVNWFIKLIDECDKELSGGGDENE